MDEVKSKENVFNLVYKIINGKANSNVFLQGISGAFGFPVTVAVDSVVILTHYLPMINDIRQIYGRNKLSADDIRPVLGAFSKEILVDIVVDKFMGNVPVAGVYFNAISAKAFTWRLGMVLAIISSRGEEITYKNISNVIKLVRLITPQTDMFKFTKPDYEAFKKIVLSVNDNDITIFETKIETALKAFE